MACFPISRGRNTDDYVFEKYPELVGLVERDKQRRIDSMKLQSRMDRVETRQTGNEKPGPPSTSKAKTKTGPLKEISNVAGSPVLKSKHSTNDLMFEMDEEAMLSPGDSMKGKTPIRGSRQVDVTESPLLGSSLIEEESFGDRSFLDGQMASPQDTLLAESSSETRAGALQRKNGLSFTPDMGAQAPWRSPMAAGKKDLKDIMAETSGTRVSNLSLGMSKESRRESSSNATPKLSQKERKKLQQQQMQERLAAEQKAKEASQNPWKLPLAPTNNPDPPPGMNGEGSQSMKTPQRPAMTLRQTVAGTPPSKPTAPVQTQSRSVSANVPSPSPLKSSTASGPSTAPVPFAPSPSNNTQPQPPAIQSVRHIPRPEPYQTSFHTPSANSLSLAAILMQQQTEKDEIHEAATAKHNLQDIQAEQEFQEWWDQESRRVQGLPDSEQPASLSAAQEGKAMRGSRGKGLFRNNNNSNNKRRGGGGGRGKDGGAGSSGPRPASDASALTQQLNQHRSDNNNRDKKQQQKQQQSSHPPPSQPRGHGGNRGGRGGARGRGGRERARV